MKALRLWESGELFPAQGQVSILRRGSKTGWCAAQIPSPSPISSPAPPLGGGGLHKGADGSNDSPTVHPDLLLTLTALLSPVFRCVDGLVGVLRPLEIQRFFKSLPAAPEITPQGTSTLLKTSLHLYSQPGTPRLYGPGSLPLPPNPGCLRSHNFSKALWSRYLLGFPDLPSLW